MGIGRIVDRRAVDDELVHVDVRLQRFRSRAPNALLIFTQSEAIATAARAALDQTGDEDLFRVRGTQAHSDTAVGRDLGRLDAWSTTETCRWRAIRRCGCGCCCGSLSECA